MFDWMSQVTKWWEVFRAALGSCSLSKTIWGANTYDLSLGLCQSPWHCSGCLLQSSHAPMLLFSAELMLLDYRFPWVRWQMAFPTCQLPDWILRGRLSSRGELKRVSYWWHYCLTSHFGLPPACGEGVWLLASHTWFVIDQSLPFSCPAETLDSIWYLFLKLADLCPSHSSTHQIC